jgi:hypothetical protein
MHIVGIIVAACGGYLVLFADKQYAAVGVFLFVVGGVAIFSSILRNKSS